MLVLTLGTDLVMEQLKVGGSSGVLLKWAHVGWRSLDPDPWHQPGGAAVEGGWGQATRWPCNKNVITFSQSCGGQGISVGHW